MRVIVFGATGYTGRSVVRELRSRGHDVWAHARAESARLETLRPDFENAGAHVDTTPWQRAALETLFKQVEPNVVFSLLGTTKKQAKDENVGGDIYEAVEGRLTRLAIDAAKDHVPARFVFLSSVGTNERTQNGYLAARARVERHLRNSGLRYTIVRAPIISGADRPEQRTGERLAAVLSNGLLRVAGGLGAHSLRRQYSSMTGRELARYLVSVAEDPDCEGRVLEPRDLRQRFG